MKTEIIAVVGPTASGKTSLAAMLAKQLDGEVISNDSMQIYRGMEIGTAAPKQEEMLGVPHHMIGCIEPTEEFSCADYAAAARPIIESVSGRGHIPVFCGGTGLYLDAVLSVGSFSDSVKDDALRLSLEKYAREWGAVALHRRLSEADPEAAKAIHPNNVRRVIRAIEIFETTGKTKTEWDAESKQNISPYSAAVIVLEFLNRQLLYSRIDARVDMMMAEGLEAEAKRLWDIGLLDEKKPAGQAIGYKEFIPYFKGEEMLGDAVCRIKQNTRRYAKRQITWFRRYRDAIRLHPDDGDGKMRTAEDICSEALKKLSIIKNERKAKQPQ